MTNAKIDNNSVPVTEGVLNTDGATPKMLYADPTTHRLLVSDGATGSDFGNDWAARDDNAKTTAAATDANGAIIPLYVDSSGNFLVKST